MAVLNGVVLSETSLLLAYTRGQLLKLAEADRFLLNPCWSPGILQRLVQGLEILGLPTTEAVQWANCCAATRPYPMAVPNDTYRKVVQKLASHGEAVADLVGLAMAQGSSFIVTSDAQVEPVKAACLEYPDRRIQCVSTGQFLLDLYQTTSPHVSVITAMEEFTAQHDDPDFGFKDLLERLAAEGAPGLKLHIEEDYGEGGIRGIEEHVQHLRRELAEQS